MPAGNPRGLSRRVWRSLLVPSFQRPPESGCGSQRPEKITLVSRRDEARDPRDLTTHAVSQRPDGPNYRWPGVAGGDPGLEKRPEGWKREDHRALARSGQVSNGTGLLIPDNSTPDFLGSPIFLKHRSTSACRSRRPCKEEALRGPESILPRPPRGWVPASSGVPRPHPLLAPPVGIRGMRGGRGGRPRACRLLPWRSRCRGRRPPGGGVGSGCLSWGVFASSRAVVAAVGEMEPGWLI